MGDEIDDVIQGILERARQRKELLSVMVSKKSQEVMDREPEGEGSHVEDLNKEILSGEAQHESWKFVKILDEALTTKSAESSCNTVLETGLSHIQKEGACSGPAEDGQCESTSEAPKAITQRGRLALASLASKYSELDDESSKDGLIRETHHFKEVHSPNNDKPVEPKGIACLVSKDSELVKRYAKEANNGDAQWGLKSSITKNITKEVAAKKWSIVTTAAAQMTCIMQTYTESLPLVSTATNVPATSFGSSGTPHNISSAPSRISVAMTAKMFEHSDNTPTTIAQTTSTVSIAKARAAFFNSLIAASTPTSIPSSVPQKNCAGIVSAAKAAFNASACTPSSTTTFRSPLAKPSKTGSVQETQSNVVSQAPENVFLSSTPTYTTVSKLNLNTKLPSSSSSVTSPSVPQNQKEEEEFDEMVSKSKIFRKDSWEDSKFSIEDKDSDVEHNFFQPDTLNDGTDEEENGDLEINDDDFSDASSDDLQQNHENDVLEVSNENISDGSAVKEEFHMMKDITNAAIPSKNCEHSGLTHGITNEMQEEVSMIKNEENLEKSEVSMRTSRKRRSGSFQKPRGYISLYEYRQLQQSRPKSQPPTKPRRAYKTGNDENIPAEQPPSTCQDSSSCPGVVMRNKKLYPDLSGEIITSPPQVSSSGELKSIQQRIRDLQNLISQELNIIHQTSNALNKCCHDLSSFAGSPEAVECHKLLLMACRKRETYIIEIEKLKAMSRSPCDSNLRGPKGRLTISEIRLKVKPEFLSKLGSSEDTTAHYFLLAIRHKDFILFTQMVSTHEGQLSGKPHRRRDYLEFPNLISLNNVEQDFKIDVEIFGMSITRTQTEPGTPKKTPRKILLTPRSSRRFESPAGPMSVRTTNFVHLTTVSLNRRNISNEMFALDRVPRSSPLQNCMFMSIRCIMENVIERKDFLTMFEDVSGLGAWHRRWFSLKNGLLSYWKYPEDELHKEPMGVIDLKDCLKNLHVKKVTREVCARPNTFEIEVIRTQRKGDRNTLTHICDETADLIRIKHWLSADTKEDCDSWCNALNEALMNIRAWHSDAGRPVSQK